MVTAAMVGLDAEVRQPRVVSTFTTRDRITPAGLREASSYILKLVRSEFGPVEYCHFLEFTTGRAERSGGMRRPHLHTLWKGLDPEAGPMVSAIAAHVLERMTGAYRQEVEEIRTPGGAMHYVASHHMKESQAPPAWWGPCRRVRPSRGYWSWPDGQKRLREKAQAKVRERRVIRQLEAAMEAQEVPDEVLWEILDEVLAAPSPSIVRVCKPWEDPLGIP
jgi:hypothetical protein